MTGAGRRARPGAEASSRMVWMGAAVFIFILVGALGWALNSRGDGQRAHDALSQALDLRAGAWRVVEATRAAEAAQRGYLLAGDDPYLAAYAQAEARALRQLDQLGAVAEDKEASLVAQLRARVQAKFAEMDRVIALRRDGLAPAATARATSGEGDRLMAQVAEQADIIVEGASRTIDARLEGESLEALRSRDSIVALLVLLAGAAAATLVLVARLLAVRRELVERARADAARQEAIFDAALEGIVRFSPEAMIVGANPAALQMFGYRSEELIGRPSELLLDPELAGSARQAAWREAAQRGGARVELTGRRKDGGLFDADMSLAQVEAADGRHYVAFIRDITQRREAERMKAEFVSTVSHELRTPLTSIAGSLGLLAGGAVGELGAQAQRLVGIAQANCQRLVRLINDVLDVDKLESGQIVYRSEAVDLAELADRAIESVRGYADPFGVEVRHLAGDALTTRGDPDRLIQILINLLSNAIRYSPRGQAVEVAMRRVGRYAQIAVRDRGPGVPEAYRERIFARFVQADASDARGKSGAGLGLYIARQIAHAHSGRLWHETPEDGGARFVLELPLDDAAEPQGPSRGVVLVSDDEATRAIVSALAGPAGAAVAERRPDQAPDPELDEGPGTSVVVIDAARQDDITAWIGWCRTRHARLVLMNPAGGCPEPGCLCLKKPLDAQDLNRLDEALRGRLPPGPPSLILHVEDDRDIREVVATALEGLAEVVSVEGLVEARALLARRQPDLAILDLDLRDGYGADLIDELTCPIIVFSAQDARFDQPAVTRVIVKSKSPLEGLVAAVRDQLDAGSEALS